MFVIELSNIILINVYGFSGGLYKENYWGKVFVVVRKEIFIFLNY